MSSKYIITVDGTPFFRDIDGVGRYNHGLLKALARQNPGVKFIVIGFRGDNVATSLVPKLANVDTYLLPLPRRIYQILFARLIAIPVDRLLPFQAMLHIAGNFTLFPYVRRSPTLTIIHDLAYKDLPETVSKRNRTFLSRRVPWSIKRSGGVGVISNFTKERLLAAYPIALKKNILIISCGLDEKFFTKIGTSSNKNSRDFCRENDLPESSYLLAVGTIEPRKNLQLLIDAFVGLPETFQNQHPLLLIGKEGWGKLLHTYDNPNIYPAGYVADDILTALYENAALFISPSLYEGFGMPALEAYALGVNVATSDTPTNRELFTKAMGVLFFDPLDVSAIR